MPTNIQYQHLPQVQVYGVTVLEPFNIVTNLLISAVCWYAFAQLRKQQARDRAQLLATYFFLIMGISTALGGIVGHGFLYATGIWGRLPGWLLSMVAVALMERAAISHARSLLAPRAGKWLSWLNYVEIISIATITCITLNFTFTELHAAYGLLFVLFSIELYAYIKTKHAAGPAFFRATALGALAALTHQMHWGINRWFNHNDVSHLIMAAAVWQYYLGVRSMVPLTGTKPNDQPTALKPCA
jgi:hypothetical protein